MVLLLPENSVIYADSVKKRILMRKPKVAN
jgi:hypothetical protein